MFEGLLQPTHLILILIILLVVFGPGKLPELGGAIGKGLREFKKASSDSASAAVPTQLGETESQTFVPTRVCPSCQAAVPSTNHYCGTCGAKIA